VANEAPSVAGTLHEQAIHKEWIENFRNPDAEASADILVGRTLALAGLPEGSTILDAGCGTGTNSRRLARAGYRVTGVDFSEFALREAEGASAGLGIDFGRGDLTKLAFPDHMFDGVFCFGVLMHVPELEKALSELIRVLKPGGCLMLMETNASSMEMLAFRLYWKRNEKVRVVRKPCGIETWSETAEGPLLARKMFIPWLVRHLAAKGLRCERRFSADLTELYIYFRWKWLKAAFHGLNRFWYAVGGSPKVATGNVLIFHKD
jgi:SAM-dependent methyltransferase